jgi:hypothetical protein
LRNKSNINSRHSHWHRRCHCGLNSNRRGWLWCSCRSWFNHRWTCSHCCSCNSRRMSHGARSTSTHVRRVGDLCQRLSSSRFLGSQSSGGFGHALLSGVRQLRRICGPRHRNTTRSDNGSATSRSGSRLLLQGRHNSSWPTGWTSTNTNTGIQRTPDYFLQATRGIQRSGLSAASHSSSGWRSYHARGRRASRAGL